MTFGFPYWSTKSPGIQFGSSSVPGLNVAIVVETFDGFTVVELDSGSSGFSVGCSGVGFSVAVVSFCLVRILKLGFLSALK